MKEKNIPDNSCYWSFEISDKRLSYLNDIVREELLENNQGKNILYNQIYNFNPGVKNFLKYNIELSAKILSKSIAEQVINNIKMVAKDYITDNCDDKDLQHLKEDEKVSLRSLIVNRTDFHKGIKDFILNHPNIDRDKLKFDFVYPELIAERLTHIVILELVKGKEIFDYDPGYHSGAHKYCWLRY